MDVKKLLCFFVMLLLIAHVNAAIVTDSITTDGSFWTAPDGVTLVNLTLIGAGSSGNAGGFVYQIGNATQYYLKFQGGGGLAGKRTVYSNIRVTPKTSYLIHVGMPGQPTVGYLSACPASGTSTFSLPIPTYTESNGGPSYVEIDGVTYLSEGGTVSNYTIECNAGYPPVISASTNYDPTGETGYLGGISAQPGSSTFYGYGGSAGIGYGSAGGGGGKGNSTLSPTGEGGSGGVGAQGIVQFSYDSTAAVAWYPSGYVSNATGDAIQSVTVTITQLLNSQSLSTDADGYFSSVTGNFITNVPVNITISKTGYETDYNYFTPLDSGNAINTTLLDAGRTCTPPCIDGVTRTSWTHSVIPASSVYLIENISRTNYQSNTSTSSGYYQFLNLTGGMVYDVWSTKPGYSNSSVYQVTTVVV